MRLRDPPIMFKFSVFMLTGVPHGSRLDGLDNNAGCGNWNDELKAHALSG
jgi:hypothetical protein